MPHWISSSILLDNFKLTPAVLPVFSGYWPYKQGYHRSLSNYTSGTAVQPVDYVACPQVSQQKVGRRIGGPTGAPVSAYLNPPLGQVNSAGCNLSN